MSEHDQTRILFVDDEPKILASLRRMLRRVRGEWDAVYANSGLEALDVLSEQRCDVIVSDIRMPHMTGVELLQEVRRRYPHMVRMVLSGQASRESVLGAARPIHQYLPKPCSFEKLKSSVDRIVALSRAVADDELHAIICGLESLPSLPENHDRLIEYLQHPDVSRNTVAPLIRRDVGMGGKLIQLLSSGFFGPPQNIADPGETVQLIGLDIFRSLVIDIKIFRRCDEQTVETLDLRRQWQKAHEMARCATMVAKSFDADATLCSAACNAAYLHGIGRVLLAKRFGDRYVRLREQYGENPRELAHAEARELGVTHGQAAAYLAGLWGLSPSVIQAIRWLDIPSEAPPEEQFSPLTAAHIGCALIHGPDGHHPLDEAYLAPLGLDDRIARWQQEWTEKQNTEVSHV